MSDRVSEFLPGYSDKQCHGGDPLKWNNFICFLFEEIGERTCPPVHIMNSIHPCESPLSIRAECWVRVVEVCDDQRRNNFVQTCDSARKNNFVQMPKLQLLTKDQSYKSTFRSKSFLSKLGIKLDATDSRGFSKLRSSYTLNFSVQVTAPITVTQS